MSIAGFVKRNAFVIAGVALPIVVVIFVALASVLPRTFVDAPTYDLVFSVAGPQRSDPHTRVTVNVVGGRLRVTAYRTEKPDYSGIPRLYLYSHENDSVREVSYTIPDVREAPAGGIDVPIEELAAYTLSTATRAPDGYVFSIQHDGGHGLFGGLFYHRGYRDHPLLKKDGAVIPIALPDSDRYYYGTRFLGWVVAWPESER